MDITERTSNQVLSTIQNEGNFRWIFLNLLMKFKKNYSNILVHYCGRLLSCCCALCKPSRSSTTLCSTYQHRAAPRPSRSNFGAIQRSPQLDPSSSGSLQQCCLLGTQQSPRMEPCAVSTTIIGDLPRPPPVWTSQPSRGHVHSRQSRCRPQSTPAGT